MFKVTPKGVLFLLSYFPGYRIHLYIPATHFFYGVYQQLQDNMKFCASPFVIISRIITLFVSTGMLIVLLDSNFGIKR